jgi:hypothetical protein
MPVIEFQHVPNYYLEPVDHDPFAPLPAPTVSQDPAAMAALQARADQAGVSPFDYLARVHDAIRNVVS